MQADTDAAVSLMSVTTYSEKWPHSPAKDAKLTQKTYTGELVPLKGVVDVTVELNKQKVNK